MSFDIHNTFLRFSNEIKETSSFDQKIELGTVAVLILRLKPNATTCSNLIDELRNEKEQAIEIIEQNIDKALSKFDNPNKSLHTEAWYNIFMNLNLAEILNYKNTAEIRLIEDSIYDKLPIDTTHLVQIARTLNTYYKPNESEMSYHFIQETLQG